MTARRELAARAAVFVGLLLFFFWFQFQFRQQLGPWVNGLMTVRAGAAVINFLTPSAAVSSRGDQIVSDAATIAVAQGCEGFDAMFMVPLCKGTFKLLVCKKSRRFVLYMLGQHSKLRGGQRRKIDTCLLSDI